MPQDPDYILDIASLNGKSASGADGENAEGSSLRGRPWIAVDWQCCHVYSRIYRTADGTCYKGKCPSCGSFVQAQVGEGGTSKRFFQAK